MTYVIDIDGTICSKVDNGDYSLSKPFNDRIEKINQLFDSGHTIIYFTARGMGRTMGDPDRSKELFYDLTKKQLKKWGVRYNQLILGKPSVDIYVDDKGIKDVDFFAN